MSKNPITSKPMRTRKDKANSGPDLSQNGKVKIPKELKELIGNGGSSVQYMDHKPAHFITNITNPMTRWGDKPYTTCRHPWCGRVVTTRGAKNHEKSCKPYPEYEAPEPKVKVKVPRAKGKALPDNVVSIKQARKKVA